MDRLGLLDFDFPLVEPYLKDVKMVLETLRGDERVSVVSDLIVSCTEIRL